jgi:hypothetical protein
MQFAIFERELTMRFLSEVIHMAAARDERPLGQQRHYRKIDFLL